MQLSFHGLRKRKLTTTTNAQHRIMRRLDNDPEVLRNGKKFNDMLNEFMDDMLSPFYQWAGSIHENLKNAPHIEEAGLALQVACSASSAGHPQDGQTYYFGANPSHEATTGESIHRLYMPKAGILRVAYVNCYVTGTAGTDEVITTYITHNASTDTLISTIETTDPFRAFSNTALNIQVARGDYIHIKIVCPTWTTNPTAWKWWGTLYLE